MMHFMRVIWGPDPGDAILLQIAVAQSRILITIDTDFGVLVFREAVMHSGIIRFPDVPADQRIEIMRQLLSNHTADLIAGAMITIRGTKIRISLPPQKPPAE